MLSVAKVRSCLGAVCCCLPLLFLLSGGASAGELKALAERWERKLDARIGFLVRDLTADWQIARRADERFALMSTFKVLLCGALLARVDEGRDSLGTKVRIEADDVVAYSPVTGKRVGTEMSVAQLCRATIRLSDNTAANLLLERIDAPAGLTRFLRTIGDETTRLDRWETALNEAAPGDPRDTTTPRAVLGSLQTLLIGKVLQPASALQLRQWMSQDGVTGALIRPHLPEGWAIGDKSGAGGHGSRGVIALIQRPDGEIFLAAIYMAESNADLSLRNTVISEIGDAMIEAIKRR